MAELDWLDFETGPGGYGWGNVGADYSSGYEAPIGPGLGWDTGGYPTGGYNEPIGPGLGWDAGGYPTGDTSGGSGLWGTLGSLGSAALGFLGKNAGTLGPLLSGAGSLAGGAIGSNAANEAARLQAAALNRGIDLQTAQWLQQQQNLSPYLQAGQQGLSTLQGLAGREQPGMPGATPAVQGSQYGLPSPYPGWQPRQFQRPDDVQAANYQWTPGQGPRAQDYRYAPGNIPTAANYRYTPGAVPTLSGAELLANDPGVQFRMDQARQQLEGSAAARGDLLSGGNLKALQSRSQDLASQEYGNAWNRAAEQARLREGWSQQASSMGWQQAESEARLREQVNQLASQQGWSQAQAEAVFREQMQQQASSQNFNQALAGQQNAYNQGLGAEQWAQKQQEAYATQLYDRQAQQAQQMYGRDVYGNTTDYDRAQQQYRQQLAQFLLPYEQQSTLANLGGQAVGMYGTQGGNAMRGISELLGQVGSAQGTGAYGSGLSWMNALTGAGNQIRPLLSGLNA